MTQTSAYVIVVLARTGSSRLPRKSLLDLCGRPILAHQIDRLKFSRRADRIILATTTLPADDELCVVAETAGIETFRGAPADVLRRLGDAAAAFHLDFMAIVGGDDVCCEGESVDAVIDAYERTGADFFSMEGMPTGTSPFGVKVSALREVLSVRADESSDGWERFFTDTGLFRCVRLGPPTEDLRHPELRLDLDYPEDFELLSAVYQQLYDGTVPSLRDVLRVIRHDEKLMALSKAVREKWLQNASATWPPLRLKPT